MPNIVFDHTEGEVVPAVTAAVTTRISPQELSTANSWSQALGNFPGLDQGDVALGSVFRSVRLSSHKTEGGTAICLCHKLATQLLA